jgi:actin-related protein 10
MFATYLPPPTSLSAAISVSAANRSTRVPQEILTDAVIEEIKTRCCFVGDFLDFSKEPSRRTPAEEEEEEEEDMYLPSSDISVPGSDLSHVTSSEHDSEYSVVSEQRPHQEDPQGESHLQALSTMYKRHSTATDIQMRVLPPSAQQAGTGRGTLLIPGWIRERAAEILFEGGDVDESSLAETILDGLLKVSKFTDNFIHYQVLRDLLGPTGPSQDNGGFYPCIRWNIYAAWIYSTTSCRNSQVNGTSSIAATDWTRKRKRAFATLR